MPALVTGASGFLGGRLAQMLCAAGEPVTVLARKGADLRHLDGLPVRVVVGDLANEAAVKAAVEGATEIFHCAACSTDWAPRARYVSANVEGTERVVAAALQSPRLRRLVHISTTDVYGYPERPCAEDGALLDAGLPYNQTKIGAERAVWAAQAKGLPMTVLRPATIYGPRGKDFTQEIATLLRQRLMATVDGGAAEGGWSYVDSVAGAAMGAAASAKAEGQAYNVCDGTGVSWRRYLLLFAEQMGVRPPWIDLPMRGATGMARGLEAMHGALRLPGRPLLTRHAVLLLGRSQEFPAGKAERGFGFRPAVSLGEGIRRSVAWLKDDAAPKRR